MIDSDRLTELQVLGFTVIEDVLDRDEAHAMRDFVVEQAFSIGVEHRHRGTARHLANLVTLDPMFLPTIDHEAVLPYIEAMMGRISSSDHLVPGLSDLAKVNRLCTVMSRLRCIGMVTTHL